MIVLLAAAGCAMRPLSFLLRLQLVDLSQISTHSQLLAGWLRFYRLWQVLTKLDCFAGGLIDCWVCRSGLLLFAARLKMALTHLPSWAQAHRSLKQVRIDNIFLNSVRFKGSRPLSWNTCADLILPKSCPRARWYTSFLYLLGAEGLKLFIGCIGIKMKTPWGVMSQAQPGSSWSSTFWSSSPVNLASAWQGMKFSWPGLHVWHKLDLCVDLSIYFKKKVFLSFLDLSPTCLKSHWTPLYCSSHSKVLCLTNNKEMSKAVVSSGLIQHQDVESIFWLSLQYPTRATMFTALIRI